MNTSLLLKDTANSYKENFIEFFIAGLITMLGSILVVTAPPLVFGLYLMSRKALDGGEVEISDVFKGFNYLVKSWTLYIFAGAIALAVTLPFIPIALIAGKMKGMGLVLIAGILYSIVYAIVVLILGVSMMYAIPFIISEGCGVISSLKKGLGVFRKHFIETIAVYLVSFLASLVLSFTFVGSVIPMTFQILAFTRLAGMEMKPAD